MKLGYSNYAMKEIDLYTALPRIKSLGYEAMEICVRDGWETAADVFDKSSRVKLVRLLNQLGFPPPPLMEALSVCSTGDDRKVMIARARASFSLARDLNFSETPLPVTTTIGAPHPIWPEDQEVIQASFLELADIAAEYKVVVAAEPHVGSTFDTPEKAVWLMEQTKHDYLKLNFDISHFVSQGIDLQKSVSLCVPYAVHTHIKDGYKVDGRVQFQLPGEGDMDLNEYMNAISEAGLMVPVYVEVSRMLSERSDYDPWSAAKFCYEALNRARPS